MKKAFKFMAIAAIAFGMSMTVACTDDSENSGNGNGNGGNTENLPTTIDENFDNGMPSDWTCIDADGDGIDWMCTSDVLGSGYGRNSSEGCAMSQSYDNNIGVLYPDNYLVSPKIKINGSTLTWYVAAQDANYPEEHYAVEVGTIENGKFTRKATVFEETFSGSSKAQTSWYQRSVDLSAYNGQGLQIAFRHYNCSDMFFLLIDDVKVQ